MNTRRTILAAAAAVALLPAGNPAWADTLDKIKSRGVMRVAVLNAYPPFGSVGSDMQLLGLDIDFARALGQKLDVKVELVPTSGSAQNIPLLQTGKVDLIVAALGTTAERAKVISFSAPYAPSFNAIYGPIDMSATKPADLVTHSVSVPRGGTEDTEFTQIAPPSVDIKRFEDDTTVLAAYSSGQVDCFVTGNATAAVFSKTSARPFKLLFRLNDEPTHVAVRRDDDALLGRINAAIADLKRDGTLSALSTKWLGAPLPDDFK